MVHLDTFHFGGDPNIGLYAVATDNFVLTGKKLSPAKRKHLAEIFNVPIIQISIYNSDLIGLFVAASSKNILVPHIIHKDELDALKKVTKKFAEVHVIKTNLTALGNNILNNDQFGIISKEFSISEAKQIKDALEIEIQRGISYNNMNLLPGAAGVLTNKGAIFPVELKASEIKKLEKSLGFEIGLGTASMGNKMLGSGVVANSNGFIVSPLSSGYEISRIDESLGFLK